MKRFELFIALGDAAEAYAENFSVDDVEKSINEDYAPSLKHIEFETEEKMRGFQSGLEFCGEECGCANFHVITPESDEERERLMSLSL